MSAKLSNEKLRELCAKKGIPLTFQRGPRAGKPKDRTALLNACRGKSAGNRVLKPQKDAWKEHFTTQQFAYCARSLMHIDEHTKIFTLEEAVLEDLPTSVLECMASGKGYETTKKCNQRHDGTYKGYSIVTKARSTLINYIKKGPRQK